MYMVSQRLAWLKKCIVHTRVIIRSTFRERGSVGDGEVFCVNLGCINTPRGAEIGADRSHGGLLQDRCLGKDVPGTRGLTLQQAISQTETYWAIVLNIA